MSEWKQGLCGCCSDITNCLLSWCCPCYVAGKVAEAVGDSCIMCGALSLCIAPCVICTERGKVRAAHNIEGSAAGDCILSWCCGCCVLAQMKTEVDGGGMAKDPVITQQPGQQPAQQPGNATTVFTTQP